MSLKKTKIHHKTYKFISFFLQNNLKPIFTTSSELFSFISSIVIDFIFKNFMLPRLYFAVVYTLISFILLLYYTQEKFRKILGVNTPGGGAQVKFHPPVSYTLFEFSSGFAQNVVSP